MTTLTSPFPNALMLRQCSVASCGRLCYKQGDYCKHHIDNPPLQWIFEPPTPDEGAANNTHAESHSIYSLLSNNKNSRFHSHFSEPLPASSSLFDSAFTHSTESASARGSITGRDTFSRDRVINTADLIPYEIPVDHEDGRPPPTMNFLYDELDSGRIEQNSITGTPAGPSSSSMMDVAEEPHLSIDTRSITSRIDDKEYSSSSRAASPAYQSPATRPQSQSVASPSVRQSTPRQHSLSPRSPVNAVCPLTPRSTQALVDRLAKLESHNHALLRENLDLKQSVSDYKSAERSLIQQIRELHLKLDDKANGTVTVTSSGAATTPSHPPPLYTPTRRAPVDLPPVQVSWMPNPSHSRVPSSSQERRPNIPPQLSPILHIPTNPNSFTQSAPISSTPLSQHSPGASPSASPFGSRPSSSSSVGESYSPAISPVSSFYTHIPVTPVQYRSQASKTTSMLSVANKFPQCQS